jgi:hypothetical protein
MPININVYFKSWYFVLPFSILYSLALSQIPSTATTDFSSYLAYISDSSYLLTSRSVFSLGFYVNEPLWLYINYLLSIVFNPDIAVRVIIFTSSFVVSSTLLRLSGLSFIWVLIALLSPISIKNSIFHIRQGLAVSFFVLGFYTQSSYFSRLLLLSSPLIHSSFFFILPLYCLSKLKSFLSFESRLKTFMYMCFGFFIVVFGLFFAYMSGARQILAYLSTEVHVSGFGFLVWLSVFLLFIAQGRSFLNSYAFEVSILSLYLSTYFIFLFSARVFESCYLLVLASGFSLTGDRLKAYTCLIPVYFFSTWLFFYSQLGL